jgi:hypothetical protein
MSTIDEEILSILARDGEIAAIKRARELCDLDLKTAAAYVRGLRTPESIPPAARASSPLSTMVSAIIVLFFGFLLVGGVYTCNRPPAPPPPPTAQELEYGHRPDVNPNNGVVYSVDKYLREHLKDPDSLQYISWSEMAPFSNEKTQGWAMRVRYRAKQSFGGYEIAEATVVVRDEQVIVFGSKQ